MARSLNRPEIADLKSLLRGPEYNLIGRACAQVALDEVLGEDIGYGPQNTLLVAERAALLALNVQQVIQTPGDEWEIREPSPEQVDEGVYRARAALAVEYAEVPRG